MATYTSNYAWTKPGGNDQVDISVLNGNLDSQDTIMHKAFTNMAQAFSAASTYAVGDIVLYDNVLYKCHTAVTVAGAWTGSTNWQVHKLSEGGSGGTSNYNDLTNKPSINGVTLSGNKTTSDLGIDKTAVGLGNVPNVSTNDQTPTFTEASTRNNIASGEKLSVIFGKVQKFFNDLKTVAFTGSYTDLTNQPQINSNTLTGNKTTSDLGINADNVMMSDGVTSVEDRVSANMMDARTDIPYDTLFTIPSDGYVRVSPAAGMTTGDINFLGPNNAAYVMARIFSQNDFKSTFVRKGMKIWISSNPANTANGYFYPLL